MQTTLIAIHNMEAYFRDEYIISSNQEDDLNALGVIPSCCSAGISTRVLRAVLYQYGAILWRRTKC